MEDARLIATSADYSDEYIAVFNSDHGVSDI